MSTETIRCVPVWSGWVRAAHGLMAVGVLFQWWSAQALAWGAMDDAFWRDWHVIAGELLLLVVVGRLILLFILPGAASWQAFVPDHAQWQGIKQMLRFYLTWGREPLPNWFAHNPLWCLVYPVMFVLLLGMSMTGLLYNTPYTVAGWLMHQWHMGLSQVLAWLVLGHVLAAILHDVKGKGAAISGMLNGLRYFHVTKTEPVKPASPFKGNTPPVYVSIDTIQRPPKQENTHVQQALEKSLGK